MLEHKSVERRNLVYTKDNLLHGYLLLLNTVLENHADLCAEYSHLKKDIVNRCLFFDKPSAKIQQIELTK